jgi:hypothetical protein
MINPPKWILAVFWTAAAYDGLLGVLFLIRPGWAFRVFEVTPPNHMGYVQFPAALLIIFGIMFAAVARDPHANRGLIVYGVLLKAAYCGVTSFYWITSGLPGMWKPFVWIDLVMAVLFVRAYSVLSRHDKADRPASTHLGRASS